MAINQSRKDGGGPRVSHAFWTLCAAILMLIAGPLVQASHAQPAATVWPVFLHDARHTALSTVDTSTNPGQLKWVVSTLDQPDPSAAVGVWTSVAIGGDGTLYVTGDNNLLAINPDSTIKWGIPLNVVQDCSPAIGADGTIYIGSYDQNLYAVTDGGQGNVSEKWAFATGGVMTTPTIGSDGTVYFGNDDDNIYAVNPDGSLRWTFTLDAPIESSSPALGPDGTLYVGSFDNSLYALTDKGQASVSEKWSFATGGTIYGSPSIGADGTIYFGSADGKFYALNPDGSLKWKFTTGGEVLSSAAIGADGTVYFGSNDKNLYALLDNGSAPKEKWAFPVGGIFAAGPAIGADGTIFVGGENSIIYAIKDNGGSATQKWTYATGGMVLSSPAIGPDGTVYVGSNDDNLYALGIAPTPVPVKLRFSRRSLNFGTVRAGRRTNFRYINIYNPLGNARHPGQTVVMQGVRLTGPGTTYSVVNGCAPVMMPGDWCYYGISFAPDVRSREVGGLQIFDSAQSSPQFIKLRGIGW